MDKGVGQEGQYLASPAAWSCLKTVSGFARAIREALRENEPSVVARYLLDLTKDFNRFYNEGKIIGDREEETCSKLALAAAAAKVLKQGLELLGIQAPEQI
jgi:arginyl-tRNA synthetase